MLKAILFNLDGVIADLSKYHFLAWKSIFSQYGIFFDKTAWKEMSNHSRTYIIENTFKNNKKNFTPEIAAEVEQKKNDLYKSLILNYLKPSDVYPNILDIIAQAKNKDIKLCVISHSKNAELIVERLGLSKAFDYVCFPPQKFDDSITRPVGSSSTTESIVNFLKKTGFIGNECIGIENTYDGIKEYNLYNIFSVAINNFDSEISKKAKMAFHTVVDINLDEIIFKYYSWLDQDDN